VKENKTLFLGLFVFLLSFVLVLLINQGDLSFYQTNVSRQDESAKETASGNKGVIIGSLSYPGESIPEDLVVCAQMVEENQEYCTDEHIKDNKFTHGVGYKLIVPTGKYYVYAAEPEKSNYKSFYTKFVTCGLSVDCPSHEKIEVEVKPGEEITGIDPGDWYSN